MSAECSTTNIVFVDDDPLILQGLQRMLRPMRNEWTMFFVETGAKALELMANTPMHVIVSDMRMPGMNGAQLLAEVKQRYPNSVRLILSGHADKELILQCVGTAHQFLSKPCEPDAIKAAISRAAALDASMKSERIKKLVRQMDKLPSLPSVYSELVEKVRDEESSIEEVGELIARDLAITAKLLKLVNSAFFGLRRQISSPAEAAAYLGMDTIKSLVLGVNAFECFEGKKFESLSLESLWSHSLAVAATARRISESENVPRNFAEESFLAGLLHDIGKLVLAVNLPDYERAFETAEKEKVPLYMAEDQIFGANHADVGGFVLSLWGLPARVVEAINFHHEPAGAASAGLSPLTTVHVANHAVHLAQSKDAQRELSSLHPEILNSISFADKIPAWMNFAE